MKQKLMNDFDKVKRTIPAAAALAGVLMMAEPANAQTPTAQTTTTQTQFSGSVYLLDHNRTFAIGAGLSRHFDFGCNWSVDASFGVLSEGRSVNLANAELDINSPEFGPASITAYAYQSALANVGLGFGATLTLWNRLHLSAEYLPISVTLENLNWGDVFLNYEFRFGSRMTVTPQAIVLFSEDGVVAAGAAIIVKLVVWNNVSLKTHINHVRSVDGSAINENATVLVNFGL